MIEVTNRATKSPRDWVDTDGDRGLREARRRMLSKYMPDARARTVSLSTGATEIIEAGEGAPLVLIHGGLSEADDWAPIVPLLAAKFHLYIPDRPGHGLSDPFNYRGLDPAEVCAVFLDDLLDSCGLRSVPLMGCSMGGFCAISFYLRHPDRVSRLILPGMPAGLQMAVPTAIYEAQKLMRQLSAPVPGTLIRSQLADPASRGRMREVVSGISAHPERVPEEFLDCMRFNTLRNYRSFQTYLDGMVTEQGLVPSMLLDGRWSQIQVPTTFIWGEKDIFSTVERGRAAAARVPASRFELIPDAGHNVSADSPDRVASIVLASFS